MDPRPHPLRPETSRAAAVVGGVCLPALVAAQLLADGTILETLGATPRLTAAALLAAAAVAGWLATARERTAPSPPRAEPGPRWSRRRTALLAGGLLLAGLPAVAPPGGPLPELVRFGPGLGRSGNALVPLGAGLWVVGVVLVLAALAGWKRVGDRPRARHRIEPFVALALAAVVLAGGALRLVRLAELPPEMISDHAEKLLDVAEVLEGRRPAFLAANGGREPLQAWWTAALVGLGLPLGFSALKLGMAAVGVLTLPAVFWLGREVGGTRLGLLAAAVTALCPWHLLIGRLGLRAAFAPLAAALALAALLRALASGRRNQWLLVGGVVGLGLYGYTAFRPMLAAIPAAVACARLAARGQEGRPPVRALARHLAAAGLLALALAAPLLRCAVLQPGEFWGRAADRVGEGSRPLAGPVGVRLVSSWARTLGMFHLTSDRTWALSPPGRPALDPVAGGLLLAGVATAAAAALRGGWREAGVLVSVPVMLSASAMALAFPEEVPHLARASGALPAVAVLAALPLDRVLARGWRLRIAGAALVVTLLAGSGVVAVHRVFVEHRALYEERSQPVSLGAAVARDFVDRGGSLDRVWLIGWPHGWDWRVLAFELGDPSWSNVLWGEGSEMRGGAEQAAAHGALPSPRLYLLGGPRAWVDVRMLEALFPEAVSARHPGRTPRQEFWSVEVREVAPP